MPVPSGSDVLLGIGFQTPDATHPYGAGQEQTDNTDFSNIAFTEASVGGSQQVQNLPVEAGQTTFTRGAYKASANYGGGLGFLPRFDARFCQLLLAVTGFGRMLEGVDFDGTAHAGVRIHEFSPGRLDRALPYLTVRKFLPHATAALGEIGLDAKAGGLELSLPAQGPAAATLSMSGLQFKFAVAPSWGDPTFDADDAFSVGVTDGSTITIAKGADSFALKCQQVSMSIANQLAAADDLRYIGSLFPLDNPVVGRAASIRATVLIEDWELYDYLFTNATNGTTIASKPMLGSLDFLVNGENEFATGFPYAMQIKSGAGEGVNPAAAENIVWSTANVLAAQPNRPILVQLTGSIVKLGAAKPFTLRVRNGVTTVAKTPGTFRVSLFAGGTTTGVLCTPKEDPGCIEGEFLSGSDPAISAVTGNGTDLWYDNGVTTGVNTNATYTISNIAADHIITVVTP